MLSIRSRSVTCVGLALLTIGLAAVPAFGHAEIAPDTATAGSEQAFTLTLENESSTAATVKVELFFPDGQEIPVLAVPDVGEWTGAPQGGAGGGPGSLGDPAPGITWQRAGGSPEEDPALGFTLRLPDRAGTIQMAVLQTYADGRVDRWIERWPVGQPEPERPGPRVTVTEAASTTTSAPPTTTRAPVPTTTTEPADAGSSSNRVVLVAGLVAIAVIIGFAVALRRRRR